MDCPTCNDLALLKMVEATMKPHVPGLRESLNAFLAWHLSVMHNLSHGDVVPESERADGRTPRPSHV